MAGTSIDDRHLMPDPMAVRRLAVSESGFVFDPVSGHSFTVNETGLEILRLLQRDSRVDSIRSALGEQFDVDPETLERDLVEFLGSLRELL